MRVSNQQDPITAHISRVLAGHALFSGLAEPVREALAAQMGWLVLPGGVQLFDQGASADGMYLLTMGRLRATRQLGQGLERELGDIVPGETIGETGLIAQAPRNARVVAIRDSELLFLPQHGFEQFSRLHLDGMLWLARVALRRSYVGPAPKTGFSSYAVLPASLETNAEAFARQFCTALGDERRVRLVDAADDAQLALSEHSDWEAEGGLIVYLAGSDPVARRRCVRQSDCVLLVANADRPAALQSRLALPGHGSRLPLHVVLLQQSDSKPGSTAEWLRRLPDSLGHHHVRDIGDVQRVARRLTGRATGIVLSGGGARGFAHLGVVRALREAGRDIDYVGGCSIGAIIGAGLAAGWSDEEMRERFRRYFVDSNPLSDWTLPLVALRSGASVSARLRSAFGVTEIEDLPLPFFSVCSNLSDGNLEVHEHGTLWKALRASSAIPGVLPPVFSAGNVLVDGGVIDNLPVDELRKRLAGDIVAVDVGGNYRLQADVEETELPPWWRLLGNWFRQRKRPSIAQILLRAGMVNSLATTRRRRRQTQMLITPQLEGIDLLDWGAFERAEAAGYEHTCALLEAAERP